MPVGNDVIDLLDGESAPSGLHRRYLDRVFTSDERAALKSSRPETSRLETSRLELWSRWAAKEATFKALAAERSGLVFSPRSFATSLMEPTADGQRRGWVDHGGLRIPLLLHHREGLLGSSLHAIAATAGELDHGHLLAEVTPVTNGEDPSRAVRRSAERCLARHLGYHERQVQIRQRRPPCFFIGGQPLTLSLSLSHHGAWIAFALGVDSGRVARWDELVEEFASL